MNWTEQDIDNLISSVENTLAKAEKLSKHSLKKDEGEEETEEQAAMPGQDAASAQQEEAPEMEPSEEEAPEEEAPEEEASEEEAPEAQAAPEQGEDQLQEEGDQPLSDEELMQIYGSMDSKELERHYAVMRHVLQQAYGQEEQQPQPAEEAPEEQSAPEMPEQQGEMQKSERLKISALEKKIQEQDEALKVITQAFETLARPQRKSVTDMQFIAKSEDSFAKKPMSSEEIQKKANELAKSGSLNKSERETINRFFLYKEGMNEVAKLINAKGGK